MEFFGKVFSWFANLSSRLPVIDFKSYFIIVLVTILVLGVIIALTYFGSKALKLKFACKKIINYLNKVDSIDDENLADFINQCINSKIPVSLKNAWLEYLNVRFGFPSEIVSDKNVYDKEVRNTKEIRPTLFLAIGLIILAIFAFWGFGTLDKIDMSVIHSFGLILIAVIYILLLFFNKKIEKDTYEIFYRMQEELDVKVDLQVERNYATDSSPLSDLAAMVDEIIARNTAKIVDLTEEMNAKDDESMKTAVEHQETPIETLIAIEEAIENNEENISKESIDEPIPVIVEEPIEETEVDQNSIEEQVSEEQVSEELAIEETPIEEPVEEEIQVEEPVENNALIEESPIEDIENAEDVIDEQTPLEDYQQVDIPPILNDQTENNVIQKEQLIDELIDPLAMYQDYLPVEDKKAEKIAPKKGIKIGKKVELSALDVEDVLMGSDFSEVEGEEEDEEDIEPLQDTLVKEEPKKKAQKKESKKVSNKKVKKK